MSEPVLVWTVLPAVRPRPAVPALAPPLVLTLLAGWLFIAGLGDRDLWASHEARAGMDAQSLLDGHFTDVPRLYDGRPEVQKPPLYYVLVALAGAARGGTVDAWCVRLPSALAGLAAVLAMYFFLASRGRPAAAMLAAFVLATAVHFTGAARTGRIDVPLTFAVALVMTGFCRALSPPVLDPDDLAPAPRRGPGLVTAYLALAAAVLLKGPIGAVLPAVAVLLWLLVQRRLPAPWRIEAWLRLAADLGLWWGLPLVLFLTVPVYAWLDLRTGGEFSWMFLLHHTLLRGTGGSDLLRSYPFWYYGPRLAIDLLPWTPVLFAGLVLAARRGWLKDDPEARFGLAWLAAMVLALSAAKFKRADYLLPAYPGAALALGCLLERALRASPRPARLAAALAALVGLTLLAWGVWLRLDLRWYESAREQARFAALVRREAPRPEEILLFRTEAHDLAFHLGSPLRLSVQWTHVDALVGESAAAPGSPGRPAHVVMPPALVEQAPRFLRASRLEEVARNTSLPGAARHEKPLVMLRVLPAAAPASPPSP